MSKPDRSIKDKPTPKIDPEAYRQRIDRLSAIFPISLDTQRNFQSFAVPIVIVWIVALENLSAAIKKCRLMMTCWFVSMMDSSIIEVRGKQTPNLMVAPRLESKKSRKSLRKEEHRRAKFPKKIEYDLTRRSDPIS